MSFNLDTRQVEGAVIVELSGHFTTGDPVRLYQEALRAQYHAGHRNFVIALGQTSNIDSSGLGALIESWASVQKLRDKTGKGHLVLLQISPKLKHLLEITRLFGVFDTFEDEAGAIAAATA